MELGGEGVFRLYDSAAPVKIIDTVCKCVGHIVPVMCPSATTQLERAKYRVLLKHTVQMYHCNIPAVHLNSIGNSPDGRFCNYVTMMTSLLFSGWWPWQMGRSMNLSHKQMVDSSLLSNKDTQQYTILYHITSRGYWWVPSCLLEMSTILLNEWW